MKNAVAICCLNAAAMLDIADTGELRDKASLARVLKANQAQADLLRKAATLTDELVVALQEIESGLANTGSTPDQYMTRIRKDQARGIALVALSKVVIRDKVTAP